MIINKKQLISNGQTQEQKKVRRDICGIIESVLREIDPYKLTLNHFAKHAFEFENYRHIYVVGAGKAVYKMGRAIEDILGKRITDGWLNVPVLPTNNVLKRIKLNKARHPMPNMAGVRGARHIMAIAQKAEADDLVIVLISGGGSALMPLPAPGILLADKIKTTSLIIKTPATIHEINCVRKHLSAIKGGQLANAAYPAQMISLCISDVVGDDHSVIAGGPTASDLSTFKQAIAVLKKYKAWNKVPARVRARMSEGVDRKFRQGRVFNFTIGNHKTALDAASRAGCKRGYNILSLGSKTQGIAREVAKKILRAKVRRPGIIMTAGETTVKVSGHGKGGRNQELVLAGLQKLKSGMCFVSFGTDGVDGITPVPVAGAIGDGSTIARAKKLGLDLQKFLSNNDSYHFFKAVGDHIITGPTGTNVGDLIMLST